MAGSWEDLLASKPYDLRKQASIFETVPVQFEFSLNPPRQRPSGDFLLVKDRPVPLVFVRNPRARRYVLRLRPDGAARVTIPRGGSLKEGRKFAERSCDWLERQLHRLASQPVRPQEWHVGTEILFRGEKVRLEMGGNGESDSIRFADERVKVADTAGDVRPAVESHLWELAARELPARVVEYLAVHALPVKRITVRNQKSRWGSCSRKGTISLNWRLIQTPPFVRDYIILHELMHLREMNHSTRFWREVERVCPYYEIAERWLKEHGSLLK